MPGTLTPAASQAHSQPASHPVPTFAGVYLAPTNINGRSPNLLTRVNIMTALGWELGAGTGGKYGPLAPVRLPWVLTRSMQTFFALPWPCREAASAAVDNARVV